MELLFSCWLHPTFLTVVLGCLPCLVGAYWIFLTAMLTLAISSPAMLART